MLRGLAPLNRLVLPQQLQSDRELRVGAAKLHADMLLIYTLDTTFADVSRADAAERHHAGHRPDQANARDVHGVGGADGHAQRLRLRPGRGEQGPRGAAERVEDGR
jgi:hypothetical protein